MAHEAAGTHFRHFIYIICVYVCLLCSSLKHHELSTEWTLRINTLSWFIHALLTSYWYTLIKTCEYMRFWSAHKRGNASLAGWCSCYIYMYHVNIIYTNVYENCIPCSLPFQCHPFSGILHPTIIHSSIHGCICRSQNIVELWRIHTHWYLYIYSYIW